jgi:acetolactate synthase-1/2/3 large subunit
LASDAVVVTDVGAGLLSGHYGLESNGIRTIFTSQGLGEMGFGLPAAIGASLGAPKRQVVCLNTDGGIMFNLQELETLRNKSLPIKLVVFNNDGYSMIRISQENLFEGRLAGSDAGKDISFPSFKSLAETFGLGYARIDSIDALSEVESLLGSDQAVLIEVIMAPSQRYLPRLGTRKAADGSLSSPGLEDLDPPLPAAITARVRGILNLE